MKTEKKIKTKLMSELGNLKAEDIKESPDQLAATIGWIQAIQWVLENE